MRSAKKDAAIENLIRDYWTAIFYHFKTSFPPQLQVGLQANVPQPHDLYEEDDDVDAALSELQVSLEGSSNNNGVNDITQVPQLSDYLRFFKPKR